MNDASGSDFETIRFLAHLQKYKIKMVDKCFLMLLDRKVQCNVCFAVINVLYETETSLLISEKISGTFTTWKFYVSYCAKKGRLLSI